jgi:hypothetical protein
VRVEEENRVGMTSAHTHTAVQDAPPAHVDLEALRTIGRFELIREIARGGMGRVFLGRDTKLGRRVAIKFLLRDDPVWVQRFLVEARATARCTHENIVTIYEVGEHDGLPYMVLEYLEGRTLSDVIEETRPTARQLAELVVPVLHALERAHEHGIVHRDLKPNNIFVTDRGHVKVLDFGVARLLEPSEELVGRSTRMMGSMEMSVATDDSLVGTIPFMSPEQWGAGEVDHTSDLWAIGIMFWRTLVGGHPAGPVVAEVLKAQLLDVDTPLPSIAKRDPHVPRELAAIVDRCLAKRKHERYQRASELLADLQRFLAPRVQPSIGDDVCPYRGLVAFGEDDAHVFFGRSSEIRTALAMLDARPLVAVIGPSGVGKSSFVHAGLVPALRSDRGAWAFHVLRPGRMPLQRLGAILESTLEPGEVPDDYASRLVEAPGLFGSMLRGAAGYRDHKILVIVDQLEELFTLCDDDATRRVFLAALLAAADDASSPVRVVMAMRADFLDRLAGYDAFLSELSKGLCFLAAPERESLREVIVRPAALAGYTFEQPWIVDDMLQAANSRGALPLVSFAAMRLWEGRDRERRMLTVAAYEAMGRVGGAFARHADQVASAMPDQKLVRAIVTRLVTPQSTRAIVDEAELRSLGDDPRAATRILDQLEEARLIQRHAEPGSPVTVEIVHEMLITEWPTLRRWLEDGHALRAFVEELRQSARQWNARGRPDDLVWRGTLADDALSHARRNVLELAATERAFLAAIAAQAARTRRRRVLGLTTLLVVLGLVIAGGAVALVMIRGAEREATRSAIEAREALDAHKAAQAERDRARERAAAAVSRESAANQRLDLTNEQLQEKVQALQVANEKAQTEEAHARAEEQRARAEAARAQRATAEAEAAKRKLEEKLAAERKENARLQQKMKEIIDVDLRKGKL